MDENKNNEANKKVKSAGKKLGKAMLNPIKKWLVMATCCLFALLLVIGLIHLVEYEIKNMITTFISSFNLSNAGDAEEGTSETSDSLIYIENVNGYYKLKTDYSKQILERLEEIKVNNEVMGFNLEDEADRELFRDMIDKYIKAEVETTFPKTGVNIFTEAFGLNDAEGNITIKRAVTESGETMKLDYEKYSSFKARVERDDESALTKFSVNPSNFKLCIARNDEITDFYNVDAGGNETFVESVGGGLAIDELDYQVLIENYAVPFNFLLTMHLVSQDVEFMNELVDLATGAKNEDGTPKEEPLVLTYVDSQQEYMSEYWYEGTIIKTIDSVSSNRDDEDDDEDDDDRSVPSVGDTSIERYINNDNVSEYASDYYDDIIDPEKRDTTTCSGKLYLSKADTWLKTFDREITRLGDETIIEEPIANVIIENASLGSGSENISNRTVGYTLSINELIEYEEPTTINREFQVVETNSEIVIDEFIELIERYPNVKNNLQSNPSNLFYLLMQNEDTQKLEKIMRYVLFRLNDIDYGVTDEDLEFLLQDVPYIYVSGGIYNGNSIPETIWVTLRSKGYSEAAVAAVLGNIEAESGFKTNDLENIFEIGRNHSIGHTDVSYTQAVNNGLNGITTGNTYSKDSFISDHYKEDCGAGYGLLQWTWSTHKLELYELAYNSGKNIDDIDVQLEYLMRQLTGVDSDSEWRTSDDPKIAAKALCTDLVDSGADSESLEFRANEAQKYYDKYKDYMPGGTYYQSSSSSSGSSQGGYSRNGGPIYEGTYTSTRNRTFTLLNQNVIEGWSHRCNRAAAAIIASGYSEQDASRLVSVVNTKYAEAGDTIVPRNNYFNLYGLDMYKDTGVGTKYYVESQSDIIENLKSGGYVMIWLNNGGHYYGKSGERWTKNIHWVAIIDYKEENGRQQIVVADHRGASWYDIDEFKDGIWRYALIREM